MLKQFRHLYPQGSLVSELIDIDRGLYIVKVSVQDRGTILGTGLAAAETVEKAEDRARERALITIDLEKVAKTLVSTQISSEKPVVATTVAPKTVTPTPQRDTNYNSYPAPSTTIEPSIPEPFSSPELEDFASFETEEVALETALVAETQIDLFDSPITPTLTAEKSLAETENIVELDFNEIRHKIDLEMKRLNWTKEQGRDFLNSTYGKRSRLHLTDDELLEFWHYLETLPN